MGPVIGLDVSKGTSVIQAFVKRNEVYGESETIRHSEVGFRRLNDMVQQLKECTGEDPVVVLEATGQYHRIVVEYLVSIGVTHFIGGP